jgi:hypothetical protein
LRVSAGRRFRRRKQIAEEFAWKFTGLRLPESMRGLVGVSDSSALMDEKDRSGV